MGYLLHALRRLTRAIRNLIRSTRTPPDYVAFTLDGSFPELPPPPGPWWQRWMGTSETSLRDLAPQFETVAADPRVRGVVLRLRTLSMTTARLQTLRGLIRKLHDADKHVVAWATAYDQATYDVASMADEVLIQPGGAIQPLGLTQSFVFLKDALERLGIEADFLQISPYKSGADSLTRAEMSPEMREMMDWLLDDLHDDQLQAIAEGRGMELDRVRSLVDGSPYTDEAALEAGLIDGIVNEDALPDRLSNDPSASLSNWPSARTRLRLPSPPQPGRHVALLRIEGDIVDGPSRRAPRRSPVPVPMLTNARAGDLSVVEQIRKLEKDRRAGAVVVWIDSGGGSATASEAMASALERLAASKPVVVAMSSLAASGGYYVATPGQWVVAQPGTLTGSIGVLYGKIVNIRMLDKLQINRETLRRGERADVYDSARPFTDAERETIWTLMARTYDVFLERVAASRAMARDEVDAIGGGRVWTGRQADEKGLVDELGGLEEAIAKARELAGLRANTGVREMPMPTSPTPGAPSAQPSGLIDYALDNLATLQQARTYCLVPFHPEPFGND
ncbi:MAG: signal peptide peptidase SppA [Candidatus Bipolaricaulia bacterium]